MFHNMIPYANHAAATSPLVLSLENPSQLETTIAARHASIRCMRLKSKNSNLNTVLFVTQPLISGNSDKEMMRIEMDL
jgi:hypothetical protein